MATPKPYTGLDFNPTGALDVSLDRSDPNSPFYEGVRVSAPPTPAAFTPSADATLVSAPAAPAFTPSPDATLVSAPFTPSADAARVYTLDEFKTKSVEELVADKDYQPVNFGVQNKDAFLADPALQSKQEQVYRARETAGTTLAEKIQAAKRGALPGLKAIGSGISRAAKVAEQFSLAGAGQRIFNAAVGPEGSATALAKDYAKTGAELAASVELASLGTDDLIRRSAREVGEGLGKLPGDLPAVARASGLPVSTPKTEMSEGDWRNRYFNDVEMAEKVEQAGRGSAETMKLVGLDAELLKTAFDIDLDPEVISEMSVATNPINFIPFGSVVGAVTNVGGKLVTRALAATKSAAQASELASILTRATEAAAVAKSVTSGTAGAALKTVGGAVQATGDVLQKTVRSVLPRGTGYGIGLGSLFGANIYKALGGLAVIRGVPKALSVGGSAIKRTGAVLAGEAKFPTAVSLAGQTLAQGARGGLQAGVEGALISLPFEIGARPEEEEQVLGMVALGAGLGAGIRGARPGARAAGRGAQNKLAETILRQVEQTDAPETPRYEGFDALNDIHEAQYAKLSPSDKKLVNWGRRLAPAEDLQIFALNGAGMKAETGSATAKGYAVKIAERPDGKPVVHIYLNTDAQALPHELFHAFEILDPKPAKALVDSVKKTVTPAQLKSFEQLYNSARNDGLPEKFWKDRLTKDEVYREIAAENFSRTFLAQDLSGVAPAVRQKAALFVSSLLEKLGVPLAGVGLAKGTPGASTLGVRPGTEQIKLGQKWLGDIIARVNDDGTLATAPAKAKSTPITVAEVEPAASGLPIEAADISAKLRKAGVSEKAITKWLEDNGYTTPVTPTTVPVPATPVPGPVIPTVPRPTPPTPIAPPLPTAPRNIRTTRTVPQDTAGVRSQVTGVEEAKASAAATGDANTIARVNELSDIIDAGSQPVEIIHSGAKAAGTAELPSGRAARRAEVASGGVRERYSKVTIPDRWVIVAGKPQLLAFSLDKIFTNMDKLAAQAAERGVSEKIPYPVENGKFSEATSELILDGISAYAENQRNGRKGDGTPLTRPTEEIGVSIPPENPDYVPRSLADDAVLAEQRMNFINALMGTEGFLPRTARETKGQVPGNVKGQIIAEVNKRQPQKPSVIRPEDITKQEFKSYPGRSIAEMNPLRDELAAAGVPMRELLDANERIFARDISQVKPRPDLEFVAPVTDTVRGGFLPAETAGAIAEVQAMSPDEFMTAAGSWDGGLTKQAWKVGLDAATPDDVTALKAAAEDASTKARERMKAGSWDAAGSWASKAQFFREAAEASTNTGSAAGAWQKSFPDRVAPFPEANPAGAFMPAEPFYSELQRVIDEKVKGDSIPAKDLAALVRNADIKPEELKWSGLDDYLAGKSKVSVPELKKFLRDNEVQLEEVEKGGSGSQVAKELEEAIETETAKLDDSIADGHLSEAAIERRRQDISELELRLSRAEKGGETTKFENYQVPGGLNYRELLLTLPEKPEFSTESAREFAKRVGISLEDALKPAAPGGYVSRYELGRRDNPKLGENFQSSHFDEPNVLAHVRFNERTDAAGKKVLFLEEVQSDWHQAGKREGYAVKDSWKDAKEFHVEPLDNGFAVVDEHGRGWVNATSRERAEQRAAELNVRGIEAGEKMGGVPDAPFKKTWPLLAVKRMIRYAAENGFDKVAWTPGDVQAARYDLSKHIGGVNITKKGPNDFSFTARNLNDEHAFGASSLTASELENHIGKDLAEKAISQPVNRSVDYSGLDLKVGGEGMRGFYDQILPKEVGAYVKKWGAKVEKSRLGASEDTSRAYRTKFVDTDDGMFLQWHTDDNEPIGPQFVTKQEAIAWKGAGGGVDAWSVTLTPSMRTDVLTKGQKLFLPQSGVAPTVTPASISRRGPTIPLPITADDLERRKD